MVTKIRSAAEKAAANQALKPTQGVPVVSSVVLPRYLSVTRHRSPARLSLTVSWPTETIRPPLHNQPDNTMKKELLYLCTLFALVGLLTNCATIIHGTSQDVSVSSNPSNAKVTVGGKEVGRTPIITDLKRKDKHIVKIELEGYQPYEIGITRKVSGWIAGNILFGGLIGLAVDAISGGMYKLSPDQITAELRDAGTSAILQDGSVFITVVLKPDPSWQKIGQLSPTGE